MYILLSTSFFFFGISVTTVNETHSPVCFMCFFFFNILVISLLFFFSPRGCIRCQGYIVLYLLLSLLCFLLFFCRFHCEKAVMSVFSVL